MVLDLIRSYKKQIAFSIFLISFFIGIFFLLPPVWHFLVFIGGKIAGRVLCYPVWRDRFIIAGFSFIVNPACIFSLTYILSDFLGKHLSYKFKAEWFFAGIYIFIGIFSLFSSVIFRGPDETSHFLRSYEISTGHMTSDKIEHSDGKNLVGRRMPENIIVSPEKLKNIPKFFEQKIDYSKEVFHIFDNTALYSPTNYIFQATGIWVTRLFTDSALAIAYGGRIFNWLFVGILLFTAIRIIPVYKFLLLVVCLSPMNLYQFNSLSADGGVFAFVTLLVALVMRLRLQNRQIFSFQFLSLYLLVILIALGKIVYIPLCFSLFFLPENLFSSARTRRFFLLFMIFSAVLINLLWTRFASSFLVNGGGDGGKALPNKQFAYVLSHPFNYAWILIKSVLLEMPSNVLRMLGYKLSASHITMPLPAVILIIDALIFAFLNGLQDINSEIFSLKQGIILIFICLLIVALIFSAEYIQWTPYKNQIVTGVQGRYFLPILFPGLASLCVLLKSRKFVFLPETLILAFVIFSNLIIFTSLMLAMM